MTLSEENLSQDIPLLEDILLPDKLKSVLLAIKTRDPLKLPLNYKTSCRILTNTNPLEKSEIDTGKVPLVDQTRTGSGHIDKKLTPAAGSQLSTLESSRRKIPSGKFKEVS
jgi:hypothetical protein